MPLAAPALWYRLRAYGRFYRSALTRFDVHSSFLSAWLDRVLDNDLWFYAFDDLPQWLAQKGAPLQRADRPAVSLGRLLFKIVVAAAPKNMAFCLPSNYIPLYLSQRALGARNNAVFLPPPFADARLQQLPAVGQAARLLTDQQALLSWLEAQGQLALLVVDAQDWDRASPDLFLQILPYVNADSQIVILNNHASPSATARWEAWREIPSVSQSVDFFQLGVLFFRPDWKTRRHWCFVPFARKPWRIGLWA
jgi:hypothetical protein